MRHWWKNPAPAPSSVATFAVTCVCGRVLSGPRLVASQSLFCPSCGGEIFVLPKSPWLERARAVRPKKTRAASRSLRPRDLLLPGAASALAVLILVLAYRWWVLPILTPARPDLPREFPGSTPTLAERLVRGQKFLAEGSFRLAAEEAKPEPRPQDLAVLAPDERLAWQQTFRQAALLADLLSEPLEDIIRHGASVREQEWQVDFRHRFLGKGLVLDAEFRRPFGGTWEVNYPLFHGQERARILVDDLKILGKVPAQDAQRLVLGVRLASVKLELPGPAWVVRFEPTSGVFLTVPSAAARICPALADKEALAIFERQSRWLR